MYYKSLIDSFKDEVDKNRIKISDERLYKDNVCFMSGTLIPKDINICPNCSSTNTIKFGKKTRVIRDDFVSNHITQLTLHYHRFKCNDCCKMWNDTLSTLSPKTSISLALKLNILEDLKLDISFTSIAKKRNISIQTVIDIFESFILFERQPLADVICVDEFKNLKHSDGKYAFVIFDPNSHKIIDVLPDRKQETIDNYLYKIDWHEKNKVKYVVSDMSNSYRTVIKKHFPKATHVIDCFHYVRHVEDALNNVRVSVQSTFKNYDPRYKILKRYWRIISVYSIDIDGESLYNPIRKKQTSVETIIDDAVNLHPNLTEAYKLTQALLKATQTLKYEEAYEWLKNWISSLKNSSVNEFKELAQLFNNWILEITNSFIRFGEKRLHNGYIEGINNKIKVIKRIAYGYSNFHHFRNRIMYIINQDISLKNVNRDLIPRKRRKQNNK